MRRTHRRRSWFFLCFLGVMASLPLTAVLQKSSSQVSSAAASPTGSETADTNPWYDQPADSEWNVASDGYGWQEETVVSADADAAFSATESASENPGEKPYPTSWNLDLEITVQCTSYGTYSGTQFFSLSTAGQV